VKRINTEGAEGLGSDEPDERKKGLGVAENSKRLGGSTRWGEEGFGSKENRYHPTTTECVSSLY